MSRLNPNDPCVVEYLTMRLQRELISCETRLSPHLVNCSHVYVQENLDRAMHDLVLRVLVAIAKTETEYKHPLNWFEAFKEKHFPKCLLKKFPVKWKVVYLDVLFPHLPPNDPRFKQPFFQIHYTKRPEL